MDLNSGYPFWLIKDGLPFNYPMLMEDSSSDVLIMGGGISGALVAHKLMDAGINCMLIDQRTIGLGSTSGSTSLLQYEIDIPLYKLEKKIGKEKAVAAYKLCESSIGLLKEIASEIGFNDFRETQSFFYAVNKSDSKWLQKEFNIRSENGFDVRLLDSIAIMEEFGIQSPCAILSAKAAQTNAYAFTHTLLQYNIKRGLKVFDRTEAVKIKHTASGVTIKTNRGLTINANKLVYATGYEVGNYIDKKIVQLKSTYAVCTEQLPAEEIPINNNTVIWNTADPYLYMRTTGDNRIIIGGRDETFYNPQKREKLLQHKTVQLGEDLKKLYPNLSCKIEFSWAGTFGSTTDGLPFIDSYKKLPNSYFALGFGGNGITFSAIAAAFLTNRIRGIKNHHDELFSFNRI